MEFDIRALELQVDSFLTERGTLEYRYHAGLSPELPLARLESSYPQLSRPETFAAVRELMSSPGTHPDNLPRLRWMLDFLAQRVQHAFAGAALGALSAFETQGKVSFCGDTLLLPAGLAQVPREPDRARRGSLDAAIGDLLWENAGTYAKRWEAAQQAARAVGQPSYLALRRSISGFSPAILEADCGDALRRTDDAYRDLLGYALKKIDPQLQAPPAGSARAHDLFHACTVPWMAGSFLSGELIPSISLCLREMGLSADANGRIRLDVEERTGKTKRALTAELQVPGDVRISLQPFGGLDDYRALLGAFGRALSAAHTSRSAPVEERRLGDATARETYARLFEHLLLDESWLRRYLRLPKPAAREAARLAAFGSLARLRHRCALIGYEAALHERGPVQPLAEEFEERLGQALFVRCHRGFYLHDPDLGLFSTQAVSSWALEVRLHSFLEQRFNEDSWRNPASGAWLKGLFQRGSAASAELIAQHAGGAMPSLAEAMTRLLEVISA